MIFLEEEKNYFIEKEKIHFKLFQEENIQKGIDNYKLAAFLKDKEIGYITVANYSDNYDFKGNFLKSLFGTKNIKKLIKYNRKKIEDDIINKQPEKLSLFSDCINNLNLKTEKILMSFLKDFYSKNLPEEFNNFLEETKNSNYVEYVFVDKDFRGQNFSQSLYEKMAKISTHNSKKLCSSIFQTDDGQKLWDKFVKNKTFPIVKRNNIYEITKDILKKDDLKQKTKLKL